MDLAEATRATFAPHVGTTFTARAQDAKGAGYAIALVLSEVTPGRDGGRPFSLLLRGPAEPRLRQAAYPLEHDALGAFELFLVPVGADAGGTDYEAVFG